VAHAQTADKTDGLESLNRVNRSMVISRLRHKVERGPQDPELLLTAWGVGYKFADVD